MLSEKIAALILLRTDFVNDEFEAVIEDLTTTNSVLVKASFEFEQLAGEDADLVLVAENIVDFASEFGTAFPNLSKAQAARVKALYASVFTSVTPEIEAAGEAVFNATIDFDMSVQAANTMANELLAAPPPDPGEEA